VTGLLSKSAMNHGDGMEPLLGKSNSTEAAGEHDGPDADGPEAMWCFQCGLEFSPDVAECVECGVPTVDTRPAAADEVGDESDEQLAYELHSWDGRIRKHLDSLLTGAGVDHAWQGATLIVRESDEEAVDALVAEADAAGRPQLDRAQPTMAYEMGDYDDEQIARVSEALSNETIPHEFDPGGDLVVHEADEDRVDAVFDNLAAGAASQFGPGVDGVKPHMVIGELFLIAGKLRKASGDAKAVQNFRQTSNLAHQLKLPFGVQSTDWRAILDDCAALSDLLDPTVGAGDLDIAEAAEQVHNRLRPLV